MAPPPAPEPPSYEPPPPPMAVPDPPAPEPAPPMPGDEQGDFDLVISDTAAEPSPAPTIPEPTGEPVGCSVCGFPMDPVWRVCPNCVSRYETSCEGCGRTLQAWWLICPWCETPKGSEHIHFGK